MYQFISFLLALACWQAGYTQNQVHPCSAPECSQFDFWLGEWNLTWNDTSKGNNSVRRILNDCVINENFSDPATNYMGMSWSMYDLNKKEWKQTWVDSQNGYIVLTGKYDNGEMILSGDNPHESTDSRTFGSVPRSNFIGVVTSRLKKL